MVGAAVAVEIEAMSLNTAFALKKWDKPLRRPLP
jgi:hypothetical protein